MKRVSSKFPLKQTALHIGGTLPGCENGAGEVNSLMPRREARMQGAGLHSGEPFMGLVSCQPEPPELWAQEGRPCRAHGIGNHRGACGRSVSEDLCKEWCAFVVCLPIPSCTPGTS